MHLFRTWEERSLNVRCQADPEIVCLLVGLFVGQPQQATEASFQGTRDIS